MTVLEDDCDGEEVGRDCDSRSSGPGGGGDGEVWSSSGLAMRRPPRDCERLMSPFILASLDDDG